MLQKFLLSALLLSSTCTILAQDVITKNNREKEQAKVKEVGPKTITYKRWDNLDGPDFVVPKSEIRSIRYENGREDFFNGSVADKTAAMEEGNYGKNIVALAPICVTNTGPVGFGLSYERFLDKKNNISFVLPFVYSINTDNIYSSSGASDNRKSTMFWAYPGAKFYLGSRHEGRVSYALGVSAVIGSGSVREDQYYYDPGTQTQRYITVENEILIGGVMITNSVNIQPSKRFYIGIELGLGMPYSVDGSRDNGLNGIYVSNPYDSEIPLANFNLKVGYRF